MEGREIFKAMSVEDFLKRQSYEFRYTFAGESGLSRRGRFHTALNEMRKGAEKDEWVGQWFQKGPQNKIYYSEKMLEECKKRFLESN